MDIVKIRKTSNQREVVQTIITIPHDIVRHFPEANKMLMEYDKSNGKVIGTPIFNDEIIMNKVTNHDGN